MKTICPRSKRPRNINVAFTAWTAKRPFYNLYRALIQLDMMDPMGSGIRVTAWYYRGVCGQAACLSNQMHVASSERVMTVVKPVR